MASFRKQRIEAEVQKAIAKLIIDGSIKDPVFGDVLLTVVRVTLSNDLQTGKVFVSCYDRDPKIRKKIISGLQRAGGFIQYKVGKKVNLRQIPVLEFFLDDSLYEGDKMVEMLDDPT